MGSHDYFRLIFAAGSLPFWTGRKKFKRFLLGQTGSFWEGETPLKALYLNHYFFGSFAPTGESTLSRQLQALIDSDYLARKPLAPDKPYKVLKLTDRGVKQYYNQLVQRRNLESPSWRLQHVSQIESPPNSRLTSAGELMEFSGRLYLTQTPEFVDPQQRVGEEKTVELVGDLSDLSPGDTVIADDLGVKTGEGVRLAVGSSTEFNKVSGAELREALTHFSAPQSAPGQKNPFVLRGKLIEVEEHEADLRLVFEKEENRVVLRCPPETAEAVDRDSEKYYCFGPVEAKIVERHKGNPVVELRDDGSIEPAGPIA